MENAGKFESQNGKAHLQCAVDELKKSGKEFYSEAERAASQLAESAQETAAPYIEEGKKLVDTVESYMKQNPGRSLLMAVGAGFIFSKLFNRN